MYPMLVPLVLLESTGPSTKFGQMVTRSMLASLAKFQAVCSASVCTNKYDDHLGLIRYDDSYA